MATVAFLHVRSQLVLPVAALVLAVGDVTMIVAPFWYMLTEVTVQVSGTREGAAAFGACWRSVIARCNRWPTGWGNWSAGSRRRHCHVSVWVGEVAIDCRTGYMDITRVGVAGEVIEVGSRGMFKILGVTCDMAIQEIWCREGGGAARMQADKRLAIKMS